MSFGFYEALYKIHQQRETHYRDGEMYCETSVDCCSLFVQTMEPVDQLLQCVDPAKDREVWVRENKTGEIRPVDMEI